MEIFRHYLFSSLEYTYRKTTAIQIDKILHGSYDVLPFQVGHFSGSDLYISWRWQQSLGSANII